MNSNSLEKQLQDITPPVADPAARLRAKRAALAEFRRIHAIEERKPAASRWSWKSSWLGGFATACVAIMGISLTFLMPEEGTKLQMPAPAPAGSAPVPAASQTTPETRDATAQGQVPAARSQPKPVSTIVAGNLQQPAVGNEPAQVAPQAGIANLMKAAESAAGTTSAAPPAGEREDGLDDVIITGTKIQAGTRANFDAQMTTITAQDMADRGITNVGDALLEMVPQNLSAYQPGLIGDEQQSGAGKDAQDRQSFFVGNTIANLRGLDPAFGTRTLTLIDGRRVGSTSSQADVVDLNSINSSMVSRVDVVTGGNSAVYGSGAIGGVVNGVLNQQDVRARQEQLRAAGATTATVAPATTGRFEQFEINPVKSVADEPVSTFSIDVDTASYSFVRRSLNQTNLRQGGGLPPMDAVRVEEMINYFDYSWPAPTSRNEPLRPTVAVSNSPWGAGKKLVHIGIKGYELPARGRPDVNLVFLMDVSGSMAPADRLPLAKQSVALVLDSLKPTDTVAIAVYAGAAGTVLPPTPVRDRQVIEQALERLQAGGSTAGAQGIQLAYNLAQQGFRKDGINRILLATDGDFNVGISDRNQLKQLVERERGKGIYLSVLGFGQGNYRDEVAQTLAQNGNGVASYIDTLQEARKVLVQEASSSLFTIASDVKIQVEFNPATVAEYRLIGYETRALKREDFNNDKVDAGDVGSGHKVTAIYEITPVGSGARLVDERRYGDARVADDKSGKGNEYGFLKIRYKLPGEKESRLMVQPIQQDAGVPAALRPDVNFSTAVAGFAQLLRGSRYTGSLSYDDVIRQAEGSLGKDEFGYRAEFVQLARRARDVGAPSCANDPSLLAALNVVNTYRQRVSQLQQTYADRHPEMVAAKAGLAGAEASLSAEMARLSAAGVNCQTTPLF